MSPTQEADALCRHAHLNALPMPWDVLLVDDPLESVEVAAARLGINPRTLRDRAWRHGFSTGAPSGRPRKGIVVGMLRSTWDKCVPPRHVDRPEVVNQPNHPRVPWTEVEDTILRLRTVRPARSRLRIDWPALLRALPRRGKAGIESRRAELGLTKQALPWSKNELRILARKFGKVSRATIMAMLHKRSWGAIVKQAKADGLIGLPTGKLVLATAARKFGYNVATFRDLLARHSVKVVHYSCCNGKEDVTSPWRYVSEAACHRAVRADMDRETMAHAASRLGVPYKTLRAWLLAAGRVMPGRRGCWQRLEPGVADAVVAANGFCAGGETLSGAAKRVHADPRNLRAWLSAAGAYSTPPRGQRVWLDPAIVDRVVNNHRSQIVGDA